MSKCPAFTGLKLKSFFDSHHFSRVKRLPRQTRFEKYTNR